MEKELSRRVLLENLGKMGAGIVLPWTIGPNLIELNLGSGEQRFLDLVRLAIQTDKPQEELDILLSCKPEEISDLLPFLKTRNARTKAMLLGWENRMGNDKEILHTDVLAICDNFRQELKPNLQLEIVYELAFSAIKAYQTPIRGVEEEQRISPMVTLAIALGETTGGIDLGQERVSWYRDHKYKEYFRKVKGPFGIDLEWDLTKIPCNGGAIGLPQVVPNTFDSIPKRYDGTVLNVFGLTEGCLTIEKILLNKGWGNKNKKNVLRSYGSDHADYFDLMWKSSAEFKNQETFVPNPRLRGLITKL